MIGGSVAIKSGGASAVNALSRGGNVSLTAASAATGGSVDITAGEGSGKYSHRRKIRTQNFNRCIIICQAP